LFLRSKTGLGEQFGSRRSLGIPDLFLSVELASLTVIIFTKVHRKSLEVASVEFGQAIGLLVRRVRAAAAQHELSLTESAVLVRLAKEGPATTAELARAESVKPQSMGATVATLEELGLVQRNPHPTDGRQMNIELTAKGVAVRNSTKDAKRTWLTQAIAKLTEEEREKLFLAGEIIKRLADS
jgi:DNA-binding MarR family transcriptional regulator